MQQSRRSFLKIGVAGAFTLAAGGAVYRLAYPPALHRFALEGGAQAVLLAIIPAMLGPVLPELGLPLSTQQEVQDLFGLLALGPARRLLAGVGGSWEQADPRQVSAFLQSWRTHSLHTLQVAYQALHDLIIGAWYADPSSWERIGYPGPLKELAA